MKQNIIIIGAGLSGLYLAYRLQDRYNITILEARSRLGGRIDSIDGHDMGPSWVWQHQKHILSLLQELDLKIFSQYTQGNALYDTRNKLEQFTPPPSAPSARVEGTLTQLIQALQNKLKETTIVVSEEVIGVTEHETGVEVKTKIQNYEANYVISTLPPRLAAKLAYVPSLPDDLLTKLQDTQTWMGNSAKCVIEFEDSFWRKESLSGFVFSHLGPLGEIHNACTKEKAALFGFVQTNAPMQNFEDDVKAQMYRLFGSAASKITAIYLVDWREEPFTASKEDSQPLSTHPIYGIDTSTYSKRILFSSTEYAQEEGGYLEGAIIRAKMISAELLTKC